MFARVPERFLQAEEDEAPQEDVIIPERAPQEPAPARNPSRAIAGWSRARTMSSAMFSLKLLSSLQHGTPLPLFPPAIANSSSPSLTPPGKPRSVLHPDNQRALAQQGFYGDNLPEGLEATDIICKEAATIEGGGRKKSAEDRRKQYHKTRSRRQASLVESGEEEFDSRDSAFKSVDFSTTTESTDSGGDLSTSAPTTPGDVFLDRTPTPGGPVFPADRLTSIDDLYLPDREFTSMGLSRSRQKLSDNLDLDTEGGFLVTPSPSRQPTVEKACTLTDSQAEGLDKMLGDGGGTNSADNSSNNVTIVVSKDSKNQSVLSPRPKRALSCGNGGGGMNFLSIVSAAVDRLSDSGSEHTLVDHQSSSSGSPRPLTGTESPRLCQGTDTVSEVDGFDSPRGRSSSHNTSGSVSPRVETSSPVKAGVSVSVVTSCHNPVLATSPVSVSGHTRQVESGPVLYVYHRTSAASSDTKTPRDENDNLQSKQIQSLHLHVNSHHGIEEELPRMSSIQSDSSGFGDAELSADNAPSNDMASLKVSNLGSSCESSATMASTHTVVNNTNNGYKPISSAGNYRSDFTSQQIRQDSRDSQKKRSRSADDLLRADGPAARSSTSPRYVTTCYIPNFNSPRAPQASEHSIPVKTLISTRGSKGAVRGPTQISVVLRPKEKSDRFGGKRTFNKREKNELPLSEELAYSSYRGVQQSPVAYRGMEDDQVLSYGRYPAGGVPVTSVPRLALTRPTLDSSVDGSRSGDELDRDDRSLSYASWSRDMPASTSSRSGRGRPRFSPHTDEESGASVEGSSVYSCASTSDSITSGGDGQMLDCYKLLRLINQPTAFKGRKTRLVHYKPRRHLREWTALRKKKRLQEETRLAQYALQKFKTELSIMETSAMTRCHMAFEDMTQEEREDVEELQHVWSEVRRQLMETEQLLTSRMKAVSAGNDNFNFLSAITVLQRLIDLLKEQNFQKQLSAEEEEQEEEEEDWEEVRGGYRSRGSRYSSLGSWAELPRASPMLRGRYSSSTSHIPLSPAFSDNSYDQLRTSLLSEIRDEMKSNIYSLKEDLHKRDSEIHRLQLQLMLEDRGKRSRLPRGSRSLPVTPKRIGVKETDV